MSNQQFFVLGITLGLNTAELERIQRGFAQPADRNGHMLKAWLMRNQLSKDQTVLTLSDAMKQVDMTSVANRLEEIFGIQPGSLFSVAVYNFYFLFFLLYISEQAVVVYVYFHAYIHLRFKHAVLGKHLNCLGRKEGNILFRGEVIM